MKNLLLLNPPSDKVLIRDYYCSKTSRTNYTYHPIDLLLQSGILSEDYNLLVTDAIADGLSDEECLHRIRNNDFNVLFFITGAVSWEEDFRFIKTIKGHKKELKIVASGDIFLENGRKRIEDNNFIDAVLLDFTNRDLANFLKGNYSSLENIIYRLDGTVHEVNIPRKRNNEFELPVPRHDLFANKNYRMPFVRHPEFATVLTDFGCPYKCSFCVMSTLGYKYRPVDNVLKEFRFLNELGVKELFFFDQTFGVKKDRARVLCEAMIAEGLKLGWVCFSRVDVVDIELLELMKRAGCHTIIFGVESASNVILKVYSKGYTKEQILETFQNCDKLGITTVGTFIFGLPEETWETAQETIELACTMPCDYASFHVAVPRMGTELRKRAFGNGFITPELDVMDQAGSFVVMPSKFLTRDDILKIRKKATKSFYMRPSYIFRRLSKVRSFYQLKSEVTQGLTLIGNNL